MNKVRAFCACLLLACFGSACATSFTGSAHVEEGRNGCERKCNGSGMEVVGMVYMGEYSDACVCSVPGRTGAAKQQLFAGASAVAGGTAGVVMQMRSQEQHAHNP